MRVGEPHGERHDLPLPAQHNPGIGVGGHCIPIDPFYLTWKAKEFDIRTKFIELAAEINSSMPDYVVNKTAEALNNLAKANTKRTTRTAE